MSALEIFRTLTSVPTAPFYEQAVTAKALAWLKKERLSYKTHRGGVVVRYVGAPGQPALAFAAHLDHPAFHLKNGKAELLGGLPPHLLDGTRVQAFPARPKDNTPLAYGTVGKKGDDYSIRWDSPPGKASFAILDLPACRLDSGWLKSRSIDDLLGCAVSLEALRLCARAKVKANVTVLLHRAEEVGFIGALDLIAEGAVSTDDTVLSIESSRELPGARPGKGPVIRLGDKACVFDGNATALLDEAAKGLKTQRLRLTGGTCEATAYLAFGYEAGGVAVPLVNYHNGWGAKAIAPEMVRLSDVEGAVRLLVAAAKAFPALPRRGVLRRRLSDRLKKATIRL
jgi:endoglucanase